jgi:hypothetical protein
MDQTNTEPTIEKPAPKKTLREVYANAASGLLLMNESVTEELQETLPTNVSPACSCCERKGS